MTGVLTLRYIRDRIADILTLKVCDKNEGFARYAYAYLRHLRKS